MSTQHPSTTTAEPDDKPTVHHWDHGHTLVHLDEDAWEIIDLLSPARSASYEQEKTTDVLLTGAKQDGTQDKHVTGIAGEVATSLVLDVPVLEGVDLSVSATGDDGADLVLRRGVLERRVDIKSHWSMPVDGPPQLLVERQKAESGEQDAYVLCQTWNSEWAVVHGWVMQEQLLNEGWVEGPPKWNQENWTMTADMLRPISELRGWMDDVGWQW